jgi:hypothetical protein
VKTDLLMELTDTCCTSDDPEDALKTIEHLIKKWNKYTQASGTLTSDIYAAILTKAMPKKQQPVVQTVITTVMAACKELDFVLVHRTLQQSICFDLTEECCKCEEAMAMAAKFQRQQQSKGKRFCTNCKMDSHTVDMCWSPGGRAEGQGPSSKGKKKGGGTGQQREACATAGPCRRRPCVHVCGIPELHAPHNRWPNHSSPRHRRVAALRRQSCQFC